VNKNRSYEIKELPNQIILAVFFLTIFGLIVLKSISQHHSGGLLQNPFSKQVLFMIPAILGAISVLFIPRFTIHKYAYALYSIGILIVLLPFLGGSHAGTYRWLNIGLPFAIQPSEFAKIFTTIALARYLSDHNLQMKQFSSIIIPFIMVLIPTAIVLKQPDLGTAIVMLIPILPMLYWAGAKPFYLFLLLAPLFSMLTAFHNIAFTTWAIILGLIIFIAQPKRLIALGLFFVNIFLGLFSPVLWNSLSNYQQGRVLTFLNPEKDPLGAAYQIIQSKTAIGSGGLFGKGWGDGTQTHLKFLPVQESDFILSVMGEELGFISISMVLLVFGYLIAQIMKQSYLSKDRFSSLALIGFATILMSHVFVNTAMTVGLIPVKGLPLPFISAGGSFLISSYLMVGLILKLSVNYSD
jgi:rod shape determining protein RodA